MKLDRYTVFYYFGALLMGIGWFLALSSHSFHGQIGLDEGTPHTEHIIQGIAIALFGLAVMLFTHKKAKIFF